MLDISNSKRALGWILGGMVGASALTWSLASAAAAAPGTVPIANACTRSAESLRTTCNLEALGNHSKAMATCVNLLGAQAVASCQAAALAKVREDRAACAEVQDAREDVCDLLGNAPYQPNFGKAFAANFVNPLNIGKTVRPNKFLSLVPGTRRVFEGIVTDESGEQVIERAEIEVTNKTKLIDGITCVVVEDQVFVDGDLKESTLDWLAQDKTGNVWYCGEAVQDLDQFDGDSPEEPELIVIDGSWKTARDGAKPGILMPAAPAVGKTFRQELLWGEAEDMATIISTTGTQSAPAGSCKGNCLVTKEFSALAPGITEIKYWAPGIGLIVVVKEQAGVREELIEAR